MALVIVLAWYALIRVQARIKTDVAEALELVLQTTQESLDMWVETQNFNLTSWLESLGWSLWSSASWKYPATKTIC